MQNLGLCNDDLRMRKAVKWGYVFPEIVSHVHEPK